MCTKGTLLKKLDLLLSVLIYAEKKNMDIESREDVKKILIKLEASYDYEGLTEFMKLLEDVNTYMDKTEKDRERMKKKLAN
jgi:hypothetical protein